MRKVILFFLGILLVLLAVNFNVIMQDHVTKQEVKAELSSWHPAWVPQQVRSWRAVRELEPELRQAIILAVDLPQEYWQQTRCYYNYFDLNDDGQREVLAVLVGPYTSGSGGSTAVLLKEEKKGWQLQQLLTLVNPPVLVSEAKTNGYHNLILLRSAGGQSAQVVQLTCDENGYYNMVNKAPVVTLPVNLQGTLLLANDLAADREQGGWLTLGK